MRVAFDGRSLAARALRGWDRYTVGLMDALSRKGIEVALLHQPHAPPRPKHIADVGCTLVEVPGRRGLYWEQIALPRALARGGYDVYHAPAEHGVPFVTSLPVVLTVHSTTDHSYVALVRSGQLPGPVERYLGYEARPERWTFANLYWRRQVRRADHLLTPSDFARGEVMEFLGIPGHRVTTTHLAVDRQFHRPPREPAAQSATLDRLGVNEPYLLYVGGFEPHKNVRGLLEVFAHVRIAQPRYALVIVGSKAIPPEVLKWTDDLRLDAHGAVRLLCDLTDDLNDLYDRASLFVSLSWRETFCLPVLEAMTRGVPVVASRWGAAPEIVGAAGALIDPRDHPAAVRTIVGLLERPDRAEVVAAARRVASGFRWDDTCDKTLGVYRNVSRE